MSGRNDNMGMEWLRLRFVGLHTVFNTTLRFRDEAGSVRLIHAATAGRPAYLFPLGPKTERHLLMDVETPAATRDSVIAVLCTRAADLEGEATSPFLHMRPAGSARYISAIGGSDTVGRDAEAAAAWEQFERVSLIARPVEQINPGFRALVAVVHQTGGWDELPTGPGILALAQRNDPFCSAAAAAVIAFADPAKLDQLPAALAALASAPAILPVLQQRLAGR